VADLPGDALQRCAPANCRDSRGPPRIVSHPLPKTVERTSSTDLDRATGRTAIRELVKVYQQARSDLRRGIAPWGGGGRDQY
jgi:hypothetical protein